MNTKMKSSFFAICFVVHGMHEFMHDSHGEMWHCVSDNICYTLLSSGDGRDTFFFSLIAIHQTPFLLAEVQMGNGI